MQESYSIAVSKYNRAIRSAVSIVGSKRELAQKVGVSPSAVTNWLQRTKRMKYDYALAIEEVTEGKVKASDLFLSRKDFEKGTKIET